MATLLLKITYNHILPPTVMKIPSLKPRRRDLYQRVQLFTNEISMRRPLKREW